MNAQPEALRLADELEAPVGTQSTYSAMQQAAAELRRLHAENERLHQINWSHEMKLSVRGYEIQIADLEAQRDALLEALKEMLEYSGLIEERCDTVTTNKARAAIEAVEETK